jgi:hypothetical protein
MDILSGMNSQGPAARTAWLGHFVSFYTEISVFLELSASGKT